MSDDSVREADAAKLLRDGRPPAVQGVPKSGDKPRPIRKKGFYRAFRRGELWAFTSYVNMEVMKAHKELVNRFARAIYSSYVPNKSVYITWPWSDKNE